MGRWHEDTSSNSNMERGRMMKRAGDSKVGIHQVGDVVDTGLAKW
jgi:hypothetical protein